MATTWGQLKTELEAEYDLKEETFVGSDELLSYVNDGIQEVEAHIHAIPGGFKYFETSTALDVTAGESEYNFPTDIFANMITTILHDDGHNRYEIKPLKDKRQILNINDTDDYAYRIVNSSSGGAKIKFYPPIRETSSNVISAWFIRRAKTITADTDVIDIPEASNFLKQYVIDKSANKERMTPDAQESPALARKRTLLIDTLTNMIPDENNEIEADFSYYSDMV